MSTERIDTVVIGGGQAGLATGYHLARLRRDFVILDAGRRVGDTWRTRWASLRLFTPTGFNHLPGTPPPACRGEAHTKDEIATYLEAYAARFTLPVRLGVRVGGLTRHRGRYAITHEDGRLEADHVVVATGPYTTPRVPEFAGRLDPAITQLHSADYRGPEQLRQGAVLVVGAGNSGAEIALELARLRPTWLAGRDTGHVPVTLGTAAYRLMTCVSVRTWPGRAIAALGARGGHPLIRVHPEDFAASAIWRVPRVVDVAGGRPMLEDGRVLDVENVIWCTGFARDHDWIKVPALAGGHDRGVIRSEPGLYFVGLPFQSSLTSHLVGGVGADARHVAEQISRRTSAGTVGGIARPGRNGTAGRTVKPMNGAIDAHDRAT